MKKRILAVFMASLFLVGMQVSASKSASAAETSAFLPEEDASL